MDYLIEGAKYWNFFRKNPDPVTDWKKFKEWVSSELASARNSGGSNHGLGSHHYILAREQIKETFGKEVLKAYDNWENEYPKTKEIKEEASYFPY